MATSTSIDPNEQIVEQYTCPVELDLLETACSFWPCLHKVNEVAAKAIIGSTKICPVCRAQITAFAPDHFVRQGVEILKRGIDVAEAVKVVRLRFTPQTLDYPGKNGVFEVGNSRFNVTWRPEYGGLPLCRSLAFQALNKDALIKNLSILGYQTFKLKVSVTFNDKNKDALNQFLVYSSLSEIRFLNFGDYEDVQFKSFFKMFLQHNQVPEEYFSLLKRLTEVDTWDLLKEYPAEKADYQLENSPNTQTLTTNSENALVRVINLEPAKLTLTFNPLTQERIEYLDFMGFDESPVIEGENAIVVMLNLLKKNNTFPKDFRIPALS